MIQKKKPTRRSLKKTSNDKDANECLEEANEKIFKENVKLKKKNLKLKEKMTSLDEERGLILHREAKRDHSLF
ncbi:hypothetical protein ACOSQ2_003503 [Xanthoceras sorbifolium]